MSIFPFQFMNDFLSLPDNGNGNGNNNDNDNDNNGSTALDAESGDDSVLSEMMSGILTIPTTDETLFLEYGSEHDAASSSDATTTGSLRTPVYGDHGAITGLPAGTFVEIYREHIARNSNVSQDAHNDYPSYDTYANTYANTYAHGDDSSMSQQTELSGVAEFEEHEAFTIVSSDPSGTGSTYHQAQEQVHFQPSRLDRSWHVDALSITTTESVYRDLASLQANSCSNSDIHHNLGSENSSLLSLRLTPSMMGSCSISVSSTNHADDQSVDTTYSERQRRSTARHDSSSFVHVADRLALQPVAEEKDCQWFARFTEQDWLRFRQDADMVLAAMMQEHDTHHDDDNAASSSNHETYIPLPPMAPPNHNVVTGGTIHPPSPPPRGSYCAADVLPSTFICAICDDVIVGSTTLDCACVRSAVCMACWEDGSCSCSVLSLNETDNDIDNDIDLEDLVVIHRNTACPSCAKPVARHVACHALDVAILHCVMALPDQHPVQTAYYHRLTAWRAQVQRRRSEWKRQHDSKARQEEVARKDALLAELIQEEERFFWDDKKKKSFWETHQFVLVALAELALVATAAAFTGGGGVMRGTLMMRK